MLLVGASWVILAQKVNPGEWWNASVGTSNDRREHQSQIHPVEEKK
jgi:hypothetical protein